MIDDSKHILRLRSALEDHLSWGKSSEWHSSVFEELSQKIFAKCQVMLSPTTLKRFWGTVNYEGQPSVSTLDTLSQFIDYPSWRAFKSATKSKKTPKFKIVVPRVVYVSIGFVAAIFLISLISTQSANTLADLNSITFSSNVLSKEYPNSVVFDFDLKGIESDNIIIQQYWDTSKTIEISDSQNQATGIYYFPGYFRAKLIINEEVIKEHDLFLKSEDWIGTIAYEPVPKYFSPVKNGTSLLCPPAVFDEVIQQKEPIVTTYHFIDDLGEISGDNFSLDVDLQILYNEKWAVCEKAFIYIIGTDGAMIFPFSKLGCSSDNFLMLNDVYLNGKTTDLSAFSTELSKPTHINIQVSQQKASVNVEEVKIYQGSYLETMGLVVGLRFQFVGLGEAYQIKLNDDSGKAINLL